MRRIAPAALLLALVACDPTGDLPPGSSTADVRSVNLVVDVPAIDVVASGGTRIDSVLFGEVTEAHAFNSTTSSFQTRSSSDDAVLGTESVDLVTDRAYTFYALGKVAGFQAVLAVDDTIFAAASSYRLRFVHGLGARVGQGLDVYLTASATNLTGLAPSISNTLFGAASAYVSADTSFRRLRITVSGIQTAIFDTTFATAFPDSSSFTVVATDTVGGGAPIRLQIVTDKAP